MSDKDDIKQEDLFENPKAWEDEWEGMPEYNNENLGEPFITATFKFNTYTDFNEFMEVIKTKLYESRKVFDGMQRKECYSAWYPAKEKTSTYRYEDES